MQTEEMLTKAGVTDIQHNDSKWPPGLDIHEMGGCRMGNDQNINARQVECIASL